MHQIPMRNSLITHTLTLLKYAALCAILGVLSGCATQQSSRTACAWCKAPIENNVYSYDMVLKSVTVLVRDPATGVIIEQRTIGSADTQAAANEVIRQEIAKNGISKDGYLFCSLRCLNSYTASKGVKEQRVRNITGE